VFCDLSIRSLARPVLPMGIALLAACASERDRSAAAAGTSADAPIRLTDDAGMVVRLASPGQRIISLVPSVTETLIALGATRQIVGRTRYDLAPEVAGLPSVGGTVDPSVEAIVNLRPDIVISWANDKPQALRERLTSLGVPVFILRIEDTTDIFRGIRTLGRLSGHDSAAAVVARAVRDTLVAIQALARRRAAPSVLYVVYNDPPMTAGPDTFIGQLIALAGGRSIFSDTKQLWPNVAIEEIVRRDPDVLVVPVGEFKSNAIGRLRRIAGWRDLRAVRSGRVAAVPSDLMSRPSPSIAQASQVLFAALHPELSLDSVHRAIAATIAARRR
jgi:cobalamin transport system substrate-binding protein